MSWQAYVDTSLVGTGHLDKACIVSAAGDSTWATTPGFSISADELKVVVAILNEGDKESKPETSRVYADGIYFAGERYVLTRADGQNLYCRQGKTGMCITKTKQAILIAHHPETAQAGNATLTVEALADYLIKLSY